MKKEKKQQKTQVLEGNRPSDHWEFQGQRTAPKRPGGVSEDSVLRISVGDELVLRKCIPRSRGTRLPWHKPWDFWGESRINGIRSVIYVVCQCHLKIQPPQRILSCGKAFGGLRVKRSPEGTNRVRCSQSPGMPCCKYWAYWLKLYLMDPLWKIQPLTMDGQAPQSKIKSVG